MKKNINNIEVEFIDNNGIGIKYVSIIPIKLNLPFIRPKDEVYLVGSKRRGNRIVKKSNAIGFIIKSRKRCSFFSPFNINIHAETFEIINVMIIQINNYDVYYDFKNKKWPNWLMDDIEKREQKAKELEQSSKDLSKLKDDIEAVKNRLSSVMEGLDSVPNQD